MRKELCIEKGFVIIEARKWENWYTFFFKLMQFVNSKNLPILQNQALCASGTCHAIVEFRGKVKDLLQ